VALDINNPGVRVGLQPEIHSGLTQMYLIHQLVHSLLVFQLAVAATNNQYLVVGLQPEIRNGGENQTASPIRMQ
jgi:hypothetical protein